MVRDDLKPVSVRVFLHCDVYGEVTNIATVPAKGPEMKAGQLIDGASYGPEALKAMGHAFDEAWLSIARNFGHDPRYIEKARLSLAHALLSVADEDSRDAEVLKRAALEAMALAYREKP